MERLSVAFQSAIAILVRGIFRAGQTDSNGSVQDPHPHDPGTTCAIRRYQLELLKRDHPTTSSDEGGGSDTEHSSKQQSCQTNSLPPLQPEHCEEDKRSERLTKLLQIPTIMTNIVKWLPRKDLIQLRLTCKVWNYVSTKELKANHALQVKVTGICPGVVNRLGRLATTMRQNQGHPFAKLFLMTYGEVGVERRLFSYSPVLNLFCIWGPQLTHLEIVKYHSCTTPNKLYITGLRHVLFNCTPALIDLKLTWHNAAEPDAEEDDTYKELPHLQKLTLDLGSDFIPLERDLFRAATGLKSLALPNIRPERILGYLREYPTLCRSLKDLTLVYPTRCNGLARLIALSRNNGWHLQKVNFYVYLPPSAFGHPRIPPSEFLSMHSEHLTELKLTTIGDRDMHPHAEDILLRVPQMYALETLTLFRPYPANIKFEGCPALKTLNMSYVQSYLDAWITFLAPFSSSPVRELNIADEWNEVYLLTTHFPHLNRLTIWMRRECLPGVWSAWPMLEALDIRVIVDEYAMDGGETARYMDHDLTGIQPSDCALLRASIAEGRIDYEEAKGMKTSGGISDMKSLREFRIRFDWKRGSGKTVISEVSGYYAFANRLQRISIENGVRFSDDCVTAIRKRLGAGSRIEFLN